VWRAWQSAWVWTTRASAAHAGTAFRATCPRPPLFVAPRLENASWVPVTGVGTTATASTRTVARSTRPTMSTIAASALIHVRPSPTLNSHAEVPLATFECASLASKTATMSSTTVARSTYRPMLITAALAERGVPVLAPTACVRPRRPEHLIGAGKDPFPPHPAWQKEAAPKAEDQSRVLDGNAGTIPAPGARPLKPCHSTNPSDLKAHACPQNNRRSKGAPSEPWHKA